MSSSDAEDPSAGSDGARFRFGGARLGRYELLGELGVGGMARVCLAKAVGEGGFERLVAVKLLHEHLANEQEFIAMFLDEARLAARIRHPNVVSTLDVQSESGKRYLVMDYVEGPALSALISTLKREGKPMPLEIALRIQLDVLSGLHAAHELKDEAGQLVGLVHRDISPHNVLVGKDGVARITDFGVARAEMRLSSTRSGELKGKVPYMAPEQIVNEPVDRRADVYAAALVLWEMLAQRRLLVADNQGALLQRIVGGAYEPAAPHHPEVFPELDELLARAMDKDLASRIGSAAQFADALEEVAHAAGVRIASTRAVAAFVVQHTPAGPSVRALPRALAGSSSTSSGVVTLTASLEGAPSRGGPAAGEGPTIPGRRAPCGAPPLTRRGGRRAVRPRRANPRRSRVSAPRARRWRRLPARRTRSLRRRPPPPEPRPSSRRPARPS